MFEMEMIQVRSSAIRAVGYDQSMQRMRITFDQGDSYDFCGVPNSTLKTRTILLPSRSRICTS